MKDTLLKGIFEESNNQSSVLAWSWKGWIGRKETGSEMELVVVNWDSDRGEKKLTL